MLKRRDSSKKPFGISTIVCNHELKTEFVNLKGNFLLALEYYNLHHKQVA